MANRDQPCGLVPCGPLRQVISQVSGGAVYPGDAVKLDNTGRVVAVSAGDTIYGVCLEYASAAGSRVNVSVDPEQLYIIQADETEVDAQTDVGNNCDITATAGSAAYKTSRMELDSSSIAASAAQLTILDIERRPDNAYGEFVDVLVRINEHQVFGKDAFAGI